MTLTLEEIDEHARRMNALLPGADMALCIAVCTAARSWVERQKRNADFYARLHPTQDSKPEREGNFVQPKHTYTGTAKIKYAGRGEFIAPTASPSDIVERLHAPTYAVDRPSDHMKLRHEAADEIERLRKWETYWSDRAVTVGADGVRLRARIAELEADKERLKLNAREVGQDLFARIAELEGALEPFRRAADLLDDRERERAAKIIEEAQIFHCWGDAEINGLEVRDRLVAAIRG